MKKTAWLFLLLTVPLGSFIPISNFQYLNYDIFISDKKVGEVRALKNTSNSITIYSVQTNLSFTLLEKYDVNYQLSSSYKNNMMIETALKNIVNGSSEDNIHLKWNGTRYEGYSNNKAVTINGKIQRSIAHLYFHEPIGVQKIFSEKFLNFQNITINRKNEYHLMLEDGHKSRYVYKNGLCTEVISTKHFFKIHLKIRS